MEQDSFYKALLSRDPRFDGVFYVGVTSTGIYCRPICPARTPKKENCKFFNSAEAAEREFFRPCLRCRPELAPGLAPVDEAHRIANLIVHRLEEGLIDEGGLEDIASHFHLSSRQIRRIIWKEFGVSPIKLRLTRRLLLAKQLLTETSLPITTIAYTSGFSSLRRFNDAFKNRYRMAPSHLRKEIKNQSKIANPLETFTLQLAYRPPFDWDSLINFLKLRSLNGIESVQGKRYARTVKLGNYKGWISVFHHPAKRVLMAELSHSLMPVLPTLLGRLRNMFDLNARPDVIAAHLMQDGFLAEAVLKHPGLRVPGGFDGFELAIRAILGQQVTVKAATTLAGRFIAAFGEKIETPDPQLHFLSPTPEKIASLKPEDIASLGITKRRAECLIALAKEVCDNRLKLEAGLYPEKVIEQLISLPGIGKWTAHYIAMRALRWPDAFPREDVALLKKLGGITAAKAEKMSQAWRPWRSYATLHLWNS